MFPDQQWGKTESTINDAIQWGKPATSRLDEPANSPPPATIRNKFITLGTIYYCTNQPLID